MNNIPWVSAEEWEARTGPDRDPNEAIHDSVFRIANLYEIKTIEGERKAFIPSEEQKVLIYDLCVRGYKALVCPKARKLGLSTVLCVIAADKIAWESGQEVALVDRTKEDAIDKLDRMVRFAIESLDPRFGVNLAITKDNDAELRIVTKSPDDLESRYRAGASFRGGTPQFLHVSEWAAIQFDEPSRSEEIKTGAMEAARHGIRVIESTWRGGADGHVWTYVEQALETPEDQKTPEDWRIRFFPWWVGKANVREGDIKRVDEATNRYLDEKEVELGIKFTPQQRLWYYFQKRDLGIFIKRENPTTLEECWSTPVEGAIYADLIERIRGEQKIIPLTPNPALEVDTVWDLGAPANTVVWYVQRLGNGQYDFIDCDGGLDLTTDERVEHMRRKGYTYGCHYVPHDAAAEQRGGLTFQEELMRAGLENVRVVPRTSDIELGINALRKILPHCRFDSERCKHGLKMLSAYHAKIEVGGKHRSENIVHDASSHYADAARVLAEADASGMLSGQGGRRFDAEGIKTLDTKAALTDVKFGNINVMERGAAFVEEAEDAAWLAMAGRPQIGRWHVIGYASLRGRHVWAVLRADFVEHEPDPRNMCVLAASVGESMMDPDIAAQRVAATSLFFGSCLVVPVSDDPEGMHRALVDAGQDRIMKRPKARVTGKGQMQIGWDAKEQMMEPMASLARRVREEQLECFHPTARQQLATFMRQPGGKVGAMAGYGDEWVKALAVGCHCFGLATPFNPAENRQLRSEGAGLAPTMWGGAGGKVSSL